MPFLAKHGSYKIVILNKLLISTRSQIPIGSNIPGNEITYMLAIENQLALYCYAGNKLTTRVCIFIRIG